MNIQGILHDWKNGLTHGEIKAKYDLLHVEEYAITMCSEGLSISQIEERLTRLRSGDKAAQIKALMQSE